MEEEGDERNMQTGNNNVRMASQEPPLSFITHNSFKQVINNYHNPRQNNSLQMQNQRMDNQQM